MNPGGLVGAVRSHLDSHLSAPRPLPVRETGPVALPWGDSAVRKQSGVDRAEIELDRLFDLSLDMLCIAGVDGHFKRINPAFERVLGFTREELLERPFIDFVHPHDKAQTLAELDRLSEGAPSIRFENRYRCKDGGFKWLSWTSTPVLEDGRLYAVARDISEQKRSEQELRDSELRMRLIVDTALDGFLTMDDGGSIIDWNARAEEIFGWSRNEALGRPLHETVIPHRYREIFLKGLEQFLATGEGRLMHNRFELTALHRDGHEFPVEYTIFPVRINDGYIFSGFVHDISRRRQREEELQRAKEQAEAANQSKSNFLANISHEIRTPMNAIIGLTELVLDGKLAPLQREYLTIVQQSGESLLTLINGILDFSKIEAGKLELEQKEFDLGETIGNTMKSLAMRAHDKGLQLNWYCEPDVPQVVVGDLARLRQVIVNLVDNAVKFTEQGEVLLNVACEARGSQTVDLHFQVVDTGIGIPLEKVEAVFEAFEQADTSTTRKFGGTGLGLSISSRIVERMQGRIWVESRERGGSTFHFTARFGCPPAERHAPTGDRDLQELRVLIVDGHSTSRRILTDTLAARGFSVTSSTSGDEALESLANAAESSTSYDVVVCDAGSPEFGCSELTRQLATDPRLGQPGVVLLITATQLEHMPRYEQWGAVSILTKPVKPAELLQALSATPVGTMETRSAVVPADTADTRPVNILLAEDSPANQKLAVGLLDKHGHKVVVVENGREALDELKSRQFDLVLMDVQMPGMDGLEATAAIRRTERDTGEHIPIVAMTAHALAGSRADFLAAGMDAFIAKPIRPQELYDTITRLTADVRSEDVAPQTGDVRLDWTSGLAAAGGDRELLKQVVAAFLQQRGELLREFERGVTTGDVSVLKRPIHTMHGALSNFGASGVLELAERIRQMMKNHNTEAAQRAWTEFRNEMDKIGAEMAEFVESETDC